MRNDPYHQALLRRLGPARRPVRSAALTVNRRARRFRASQRRDQPVFECPICGYQGRFLDRSFQVGHRRWAECARCGALERHRFQAEVVGTHLLPRFDRAGVRCLQIAPDPLTGWLRDRIKGQVVTGDLDDPRADIAVDLRAIDLAAGSFDVVFASHVLEHVDDDALAIREIHRILAPGGVAVLPVPVVAVRTVEYGAPNPREENHVRAPGQDYFDRYQMVFASVDLISSKDVRQEIQPWIYEDRTRFPTPDLPHRPAMPGRRHADVVPLCWK